MSSRTLSANGIALIKKFEGCRLTAYKVQSSDKYYTIGYGHYGADVKSGQTITDEEATMLLIADCNRFVSHVNKYMDIYNFNQNQFDALVSFAFNTGSIKNLTNNGTRTITEISASMLNYCKSNGVILQGLVKRRKAEQELFNKNIRSDEKTVEQLAVEVLAGQWGNGKARKKALSDAGYDYKTVQAMVNKMCKVSNLTETEVAKEVIAGKWGNGESRKKALSDAGYDYNAVQALVNKIMKGE